MKNYSNAYNNQCNQSWQRRRMMGNTNVGTMEPCPCQKEKKKEKPLGMAYVPVQKFENILCARDGFQQGSMFSDLILPFYGRPVENCGCMGKGMKR